MEKGTRAFVSYVRGYKEHQCRFIFRFPELDLGRMATAFALLQLPKMKEVRRGSSNNIIPPPPLMILHVCDA
jgi:ATP-dependent RNA helicase DDX55/SPB4